MYKRYENSIIKKTKDGKRYLGNVSYPSIPISSKDVYILSKKGDRLDVISYLFYKDIRLWWVIARANQIGKGSLLVPTEIQLRIPMDLSNINNLFKLVNNS